MVMSEVEVLRAACCIAAADAIISDKEQAYLKKLADRTGVGAAPLETMIDRALREPNFRDEQFDLLVNDTDSALRTLFRVALADRQLTDTERDMLAHFAVHLGITPKRFLKYLRAANKVIDK